MLNNNLSLGIDSSPFPIRAKQPLPFWAAPIREGVYGGEYLNTLVVVGNHETTLVRLGRLLNQDENVGALVVPTGGIPLSEAVQYGLFDEQTFLRALRQIARRQNVKSMRLLLPNILARRMGWLNIKHLEEFPIQIIPDGFSALETYLLYSENQFLHNKRSVFSAPLLRLFTGLKFFLGQALLFAVPLFALGWQSLAFGTASLLLSTLVLSLFWHYLPGIGGLKGLVSGGVLAILVGWFLASMGYLSWVETLRYGFGFWLSTFWMGLVLFGVDTPNSSKGQKYA
jgi:hypothetical protein